MDLREYLFEPLGANSFTARLTAAEPGILAGMSNALGQASVLDLTVLSSAGEGSRLLPGTCVLEVSGNAEQIARAEEQLLACVGKPSGVATAAAAFCDAARGRARIVCGAWKKVGVEVRQSLRAAIAVGGAGIRLVDEPFVYIDKNYVRMFSGIAEVVGRACSMNGRVVAVQLRGETGPIFEEAWAACCAGARILMVDTGKVEDLRAVVETAVQRGFRDRTKIAFGGSVTPERLQEVIAAGADIIDIGRAIIDAPLIDFRFDVQVNTATN